MCVRFCDLFFFFKQKTAYEMRISDWSSDVCSSDLFGSAIALKVAANPDGARFGRLIVADNGARPPREDPFDNRKPWTNPGYNSLDEGAARFRLRPEQRRDNDY